MGLDVYRTVVPETVRHEINNLRQENISLRERIEMRHSRAVLEVVTAASFGTSAIAFLAAAGAEPLGLVSLAIAGLVGGVFGWVKLTQRSYQ